MKKIGTLVIVAAMLMSMFAAQVFATGGSFKLVIPDELKDQIDPQLIEELQDHVDQRIMEELDKQTELRPSHERIEDLHNPSTRFPGTEQGKIKVAGSSMAVYTGLTLINGQALDFTEIGGGRITYKAPEYSRLSNVTVLASGGTLTIETPKEFNMNVRDWIVTYVDTSAGSVLLSASDYDYDIKVGGKKVKAGTRISAYETISFGSNKGTVIYYEDETSTIPLFKAEGAKSYKLGFGNSQDNKIIAWTVRNCDPSHNVVEVFPYGLGGTRYTLLDRGRTPLYLGDVYAGMCVEVGASIKISTENFNDIDIRYRLPNNGVVEQSIEGEVFNVPSPGADYDPIKYWIVIHSNSTINTLELQPLYDVKPSFDYYYPTSGGTKDNLWHVGKGGDITAYVEAGTLYLNGQGEMEDYNYGFAPWKTAGSNYVIKNLIVGEGITSLGIESFKYLQDLENVSLPSTLISIRKSSFANCSSLKYIEIPSSVQTIGYSTFVGCENLTRIKIGIGLQTVQSDAFAFVPLEKVEYEGSEAAWNNINIDLSSGHNDSLVNAEKIFGNKYTNATASIIDSVNSINTVVLMITAGVICTCAIICTTVYARKNTAKKQ